MISKLDNRPATYEEARSYINSMQTCGGGAIRPFVLYKLFDILIPSANNSSQIRSLVDTYCALCNEYYLISIREKHPPTEFFLTAMRWEKYYIPLQTRERCVKILKEQEFIDYRNQRNPYANFNTVRMYNINLKWLKTFSEIAEETLKKSKADRETFEVAFARLFPEFYSKKK